MKNKYYGFIDILRLIGAFAVVAAHIISLVLTYDTSVLKPGAINIYNTVISLMSFCVPLFIIVTGFLFLGNSKEYKYKEIYPHILKILAALLIFGMFYSIMEQIFNSKSFNLLMIINALYDILSADLWAHMWYLYMIIGIYLLIPMIKPFFQYRSLKENLILTGIMLLFQAIIPFISEIFAIEIGFGLPMGANLLFYVFVGGCLAKMDIRPIDFNISVAGLILSIVGIIYMYVSGNKLIKVDFDCPPVCIMAISIFIILHKLLENYNSNKFIKGLSVLTWGIYLLHPFFINLQVKLFNINPNNFYPIITVPINCIFIFAVTAVCIYFMRKIPIVGKYVL